MNSDGFSIREEYELLALHRALMEARFGGDSNDMDVAGSPILANLHRRVVESILEADSPVGGNKDQWMEWLRIDEGRREWSAAVRHARISSWWEALNDEAKLGAARDLLAPFSVSSELVDRFVKEVDDEHFF